MDCHDQRFGLGAECLPFEKGEYEYRNLAPSQQLALSSLKNRRLEDTSPFLFSRPGYDSQDFLSAQHCSFTAQLPSLSLYDNGDVQEYSRAFGSTTHEADSFLNALEDYLEAPGNGKFGNGKKNRFEKPSLTSTVGEYSGVVLKLEPDDLEENSNLDFHRESAFHLATTHANFSPNQWQGKYRDDFETFSEETATEELKTDFVDDDDDEDYEESEKKRKKSCRKKRKKKAKKKPKTKQAKKARKNSSVLKEPKKPKTAYNLYVKREKPRIMMLGYDFKESAKIVADKWHELGVSERRMLQEEVELDKERFRIEMIEYTRLKRELEAQHETAAAEQEKPNGNVIINDNVKNEQEAEVQIKAETTEPVYMSLVQTMAFEGK